MLYDLRFEGLRKISKNLIYIISPTVFLITIILRLSWLRSDLGSLVQGVIPDDAFYYFEIARRFWLGGGMTFDGITPATGFHPLWLILILPFFVNATPGMLQPVTNVLFLATLLSVFSAFLVGRLVYSLTDNVWLSGFVAIAFACNLWIVRESLNGLETILAVSLVVLFLVYLLRFLKDPKLRKVIFLGIIASLIFLTRSDLVILLVFLSLIFLIKRFYWIYLVLYTGIVGVTIVVTLSINYLLTGQPLQSSAVAMPWLAHENWYRTHEGATFYDLNKHGLELTWISIVRSFNALGFAVSSIIIVSASIVLLLGVLRWRQLSLKTVHGAFVSLLFLLGLLVLHIVHGYIRWYPRDWYFVYWVILAYTLPLCVNIPETPLL